MSGALVALKTTQANLTSTRPLLASVGLMNGCSLMGRFPHCGSVVVPCCVGLRAETPCCLCFLWDEFDARIVDGTPVHDSPVSVFPPSLRGHLGVVCGKHPPSSTISSLRPSALSSRRLGRGRVPRFDGLYLLSVSTRCAGRVHVTDVARKRIVINRLLPFVSLEPFGFNFAGSRSIDRASTPFEKLDCCYSK